MKQFNVTLFNMNNPKDIEVVTINANTQDEAEEIAVSGGLVNIATGWGVLDSVEVK